MSPFLRGVGVPDVGLGRPVTQLLCDDQRLPATIQGDLVIEKPSFWGRQGKKRKPRVVIGPGSRVEGTIVVEHEIELYISESAEVGHVEGVMSIDDAQRFSGNRP